MCHLGSRAFNAAIPVAPFGANLRQPTCGKLGLACQRLHFGEKFGEQCAARVEIARRRKAAPPYPPAAAVRRACSPLRWRSSRLHPRRLKAGSLPPPKRIAGRRCGRPHARPPACRSRAAWNARCCSRAAARALGLRACADAAASASAASTVRRLCSSLDAHRLQLRFDVGEAVRPASRRAAPVGALAATEKPSQRQRSPSRETRRWPGCSRSTRSVAALRSTTPICASRRASWPGRVTCAASGSTPSGSGGSGGLDLGTRPAHRRWDRSALPGHRPAPPPGLPHSPSRRRADR